MHRFGVNPRLLVASVADLVDPRQSHRREDERHVDDRLPHEDLAGIVGDLRIAAVVEVRRADERLQKVHGRDADDRHGELDLQHVGVHVTEPLRLIRMVVQVDARHEGLVSADDHHDQEVRDHDHVDEPEDHQHHLRLGEIRDPVRDVPQLLHEREHVEELGDDQADVERCLQPSRCEEESGERPGGR